MTNRFRGQINNMTKILVLNVGWSNKGNLALVHSTMETIKYFVPDAKFTLMGPDNIDHDSFKVKKQLGAVGSRRKSHYVISAIISAHYLLLCACIYFLSYCKITMPVSKKSSLFDYYDCDIVIESGGDQLSGEYGFGTLGSFRNILYPILLGKPVILYGDSLGYFNNHILDFIAKFVLNRTRLILLREELSRKYLNYIGVDKPDIYVTADPAFLLKASHESRFLEILNEENIDQLQRPIIGINPNGLIGRFIKPENNMAGANIADVMAKVIDTIVEQLDANIIMVPHVYTNAVDDRIAIKAIFEKVKYKSKVKIICGEYEPWDIKRIIGECDLFIGARMHATIASTSMLVPTVSIAYSHKMHGIIGEMLRQDKYVLDINDISYENLISTIMNAWENREIIRAELEVKIPEVREKSMLNGKLVEGFLDQLQD